MFNNFKTVKIKLYAFSIVVLLLEMCKTQFCTSLVLLSLGGIALKFNKNVLFSIILITCSILLSFLNNYFTNIELSNKIWSLILTLYFIALPALLGIMLKVIVNNKKHAVIIISLCTAISLICDAVILGEKIVLGLLTRAIPFLITMIYYFIAFSIINRRKKANAVTITIILTLLAALTFWWCNLLFLTNAK